MDPESVVRLADVQLALNKTLPEMADLANTYLHEEPYTKDELAKLLECTEAELETKILSVNTRDVESFKLKQRALHVFQGLYSVHVLGETCQQQTFQHCILATNYRGQSSLAIPRRVQQRFSRGVRVAGEVDVGFPL